MNGMRHGVLAATIAVAVVGCGLAAPASTPTLTPTPSAAATATASIVVTSGVQPHRSPRPIATAVGPTPPAATRAPSATPFPPIPGVDALTGTDGRLTILLLGSDARPGLAGERTDVIMVMTIDPATGAVSLVSLPRDMRNVPTGPGQAYPVQVTGLFQSYELAGMSRMQALARMKQALGYAFGIEIDYYAIIKFTGVVSLINHIGGVDVSLAARFDDSTPPISHLNHNKGLHLHKGVNHLDGGVALAFARSRHTTSDYDRSRRQHVLLAAVADKVRQMGTSAIAPLAQFAFTQIQTDVPLSALPTLYALAQEANLSNYRGVVLGPTKYASSGAILYSIYIKLDAVRALFHKIFSR
jgi:LCP family protein required for cell wall assembly